jgi:hypothetical protein
MGWQELPGGSPHGAAAGGMGLNASGKTVYGIRIEVKTPN